MLGLIVIVAIDVVFIFLMGIFDPTSILFVLSNVTFLESGPFLLIGGLMLMLGGFPSLSMATRKKWDKTMSKETITHSYIPLLLGGLLILFAIIASLFVY